MKRRKLLATLGLSATTIVGGCGAVWLATREGLSLTVENVSPERRSATVSLDATNDGVAYRETFEVPAGETATRTDVVGPGEYRLRIEAGDNALERDLDTRFCRTPVVEAELDMGNAIAVGTRC